MEEQASALLTTLKRTAATVDTKLAQFNSLKASIKHQRVPDSSQTTIFECLKLAITSPVSQALVTAGFSTLGHLIKRLGLQDQRHVIHTQGTKLFPALLDRLGDPKEGHRNAASQAFSDYWTYCAQDVETLIRDSALAGTNTRAKEAAMLWVLRTSKDEGLQFRSFVPHLMQCLEDQDGSVRETAKSTVVELFRDAPERAKADLKRQIHIYGVRHAIATQIVNQLSPPTSADGHGDFKASTNSNTAREPPTLKDVKQGLASEDGGPPTPETSQMDPLYVYTQRELEDMLREMQPHFVGKETEQNWVLRDKGVTKLRRLIRGNASADHHVVFLAGIKTLLDGLLNTANSLRTTLSSNGCHLIQDLARTMGSSLDGMAEIVLATFIKMCASTKHIMAENGNATVNVIFSNVTYSVRIMQHIWSACGDKNVQPRIYASEWLKTIIKKQGQHRAHFEHSGGFELAEKSIKKGVSDANPKVREGMRATYWLFAGLWPDRAEVLMAGLEAKYQTALEKDPNNPHTSMKSSMTGASTTGPVSSSLPSKSNLKASQSRASLKEAMMAQKKAMMAQKNMLERPTSAMSTFSPAPPKQATKPQSNLSLSTNSRGPVTGFSLTSASTSTSTSTRQPSASSTSERAPGSSLFSAPMRRPRRPDVPRPMTADPYASRDRKPVEKPPPLPSGLSPTATLKTPIKESSNKSLKQQKPYTGHSPSTSPEKNHAKVEAPTLKKRPTSEDAEEFDDSIDHSRINSNFTMLIPDIKMSHEQNTKIDLESTEKPDLPDPSQALSLGTTDVDNFTMVIPNLSFSREPEFSNLGRRPPSQRSPSNKPTIVSPGISGFDACVNQVGTGGSIDVFEDPATAKTPSPSTSPESSKTNGALSDMPLTEKVANTSPLREQPTTPIYRDQRSRSPLQRARSPLANRENLLTDGMLKDMKTLQISTGDLAKRRRLLESGVERIKSRTLDAHGFRKLQDLIKADNDIWVVASGGKQSKFEDILFALLDYLLAANGSLSGSVIKAQTLKLQALVTIKTLLSHPRAEPVTYQGDVLTSLIEARQTFESTSHVTAELEQIAERIVQTGDKSDLLGKVVDIFDSRHERDAKTITMALEVLTALLRPSSAPTNSVMHQNGDNTPSPSPTRSTKPLPVSTTSAPSQTQRLASIAARFLNSPHPEVRQADTEFCVELHEFVGKGETFWRLLAGTDQKLKQENLNLLSYYFARRNAAGDGDGDGNEDGPEGAAGVAGAIRDGGGR